MSDHIEYNGWVLRQVLFDRGEPVGHREPVEGPVTLETVYETIVNWDECGGKRSRRELARRIVALYAQTPQRPLTDEEIWDEVKAADLDWQTGWSLDEDASNRYITFARAIEAAHGIKD